MTLILKMKRRNASVVETSFSEVLFISETPVAFRRKDLANRAFVGQRVLSQFETTQLNNWLNGQEFDIVSEATIDASVISASGLAVPNVAPEVDLTNRIDLVIASGRTTVSYEIAQDDVTISDATHGPGQLDKIWEVVDGPGGADVVIQGPGSQTPEFTFNVPGGYRVRLTVTEPDEGLMASATMRFVITSAV